MKPIPALAAPLIALLTSCGPADKADDKLARRDPAITAALSDPLMTDPDLASQNRGGAALTGGGPATGEMPLLRRGPEEAAAARDAAAALFGKNIPAAPIAEASTAASPRDAAITARALAAALLPISPACAAKAQYSAIWATRLPAAFPVYPRGHVGEAAGADGQGCTWRMVGFVSAASAADLTNFYYARARAAGFVVHRTSAGVDEMIAARRGAAMMTVLVRLRADGMAEAEIATSG